MTKDPVESTIAPAADHTVFPGYIERKVLPQPTGRRWFPFP